jgi:hypothetical protein
MSTLRRTKFGQLIRVRAPTFFAPNARMGQQHQSPGQSSETERRAAPPWVTAKRPNVALKGANYATSLACIPA